MKRKRTGSRCRGWLGLTTEALEVRHVMAAAVAVNDTFSVQEDTPLIIASPNTTLVPEGSVWRYLDDGSDQGTAWRQPGFIDTSWAFGPAQLGYGDNDEVTTVGFGPDPQNRFATTYFRHTFDVTNAASILGLNLELIRDDGYAVYLNGTEIARDGLVQDPTYQDYATVVIGGADESAWVPVTVDPALLVNGPNTIAVEIHQANPNSSDISFDLRLVPTVGKAGVLLNDTDADNDPLSARLITGPQHGSLSLNTDGSFSYFPTINYSGPDTFQYVANDGTSDSNIATVTINVQPVNDPPVAMPDQYHALAGTGVTIPVALGVMTNDSDVDGNPLTATRVQTVTNGTLTFLTNGAFTYVPNAGFIGTDTFTYRVSDGTVNSTTVPVTIVVTQTNRVPTTDGDNYVAVEDTTLNINIPFAPPTGPVISANFDIGIPPEFSGVTTLTPVGTLAGLGNPGNTFSGNLIQNFSNPINQGDPASPTAVTINNLPPHESINIGFLLALFNGWDGNTAANPARTPDQFQIRVDGVLVFDHTFDNTNAGDMTYVPPVGGRFVHGTNIGFGDGNDAAYDMSLEPSLRAIPHTASSVTIEWVATGDGYRVPINGTREDESFALDNVVVTVNAGGTTIETETLIGSGAIWSYLDDGSNQGTAWRAPNYNDNTWATGPAELGYGDGDEATIVGFGGDASNKFITTYFRHSFQVADADLVTQLDLELKRDDGAVVYLNGVQIALSNLPDNPAFDTPAQNGSANENVFLAFPGIDPGLLVDGENVLAVEIHQDAGTSSDISMDVRLVAQVLAAPLVQTYGVLDNDSDPDGGPITASLVTGPTHGSLTLRSNGTFTYTPNPNYSGTDSFTYRAADLFSQSPPETVTITIQPGPNDAPVALDKSYSVNEDGTLTVAVGQGLLVGATDADQDPLTAVLVTAPLHGTVTVAPNGSFVYTPAADYFGSDSFTFAANDGSTNSLPRTATITVTGVADAPRGTADEYFVVPGQAITVNAANGVLANDIEVDGQNMTASLVTNVTSGTLTLNPNGSFTYTPAAGFRGVTTFVYRASDGSLQSANTTVRLVVNSPPVAVADSFTVAEDNVLNVPAPGVLVNDSDSDNDPRTAELVTPTQHGTLTLDVSGAFIYTPENNYNGPDSFTYRAIAAGQLSNVVTVNLTVTAVNDAPIAAADEYSAIRGRALVVTVAEGVLANDQEVDGMPLTAQLVPNQGPTNGTLTLNADGSFTYTPNANFLGTDQFSYTASDGTLFSPTTVATINVTSGGEAVVISEIMYHPSSENNLEEYIELHNRGDFAIDLTGWQLTQGVSYTFPAVNIAPHGFVVVAADVARFRAKYPTVTAPIVGGWTGQLSNTAEDIELEDPTGERIDLVSYADNGDWAVRRLLPDPRQGLNGWQWVASHDGGGNSLELVNPVISNNYGQNWLASTTSQGTPGRTNSVNNAITAPLITDVKHSPAIPRTGEPVRVRAELRDEEGSNLTATLFYRVASANPGAFLSTTMFDDGLHDDKLAGDGIYAAELPPQANLAVVEFYVRASDGTNSRTYPAPTDNNGAQGANMLYQVDNSTYEGSQAVYRIILTEQERARFASLSRQSNAEMNATFINLDGTSSEIRYNAGIRFRGNGSRGRPVANYRINLASDNPWQGIDAMNMNSQYPHSQMIGMTTLALAGLLNEEVTASQLRINGANPASQPDVQHGSFARVEVTNSDFVRNHTPNDPGANIYRGIFGTLGYLGESPNSYNGPYDKQTNVSENDWTDLIRLTRTLDPGQTPDNVFLATVEDVVNVDQWMRFFAANALLVNEENGIINGAGDDYSIYCGVVDPRCQLLAHDLDTVLGQGDSGADPNRTIFEVENTPAFSRLLSFPKYLGLYYHHLQDLATTIFAPANMNATIDNLLGDWVAPANIAAMKQFNADRVNYVLSQIPASYEIPARVLLENVPASSTPLTTTNITVGGQGVTHYRYSLDGGALSTERPVSTAIQLTGLTAGNHVLSVIGRNTQGTYQNVNTAATYSWEVRAAANSNLVINEILAFNNGVFNHQGTFPDAIELLNRGTSSINLSGMTLTDDPTIPNRYTFPANTTLAAGQTLVVLANAPDGTTGLHAGFSLDNDGETIYLYQSVANGGALLDSVQFGMQLPNLSVGRGSDFKFTLNTPTIGAANSVLATQSVNSLRINEWLGDGNRFRGDDFIEIYNPSTGPVDLGGMYLTDTPDGFRNKHQITPLSFIGANGYVVMNADGNASAGANHTNFSVNANRDSIALYDKHLRLIDQVVVLQQKTDVSEGRSPDGGLLYSFFGLPTPGLPNVDNPQAGRLLASLRITELHYNPSTNLETEEFIELQNISDLPLDITGVRLRSGITFDFPSTTLQPRQVIVVAKDLAAFRARYGTGINVVGPYTGSLSNGGEEISIRLPAPLEIDMIRFDYDDDPVEGWPTLADGAGSSLIIVDTEGDYSAPSNWVASVAPGGTPGRIGRTALGDFDADGDLDAADVNALVGQIIAGTNNVNYELTGNNVLDVNDLTNWVTVQYKTFMGDANLDRVVDGSDFNIWNQNKFSNQQGWTRGDFNASGGIDASDLNVWNTNKFRSAAALAPSARTVVRAPLANRLLVAATDGAFSAMSDEKLSDATSSDFQAIAACVPVQNVDAAFSDATLGMAPARKLRGSRSRFESMGRRMTNDAESLELPTQIDEQLL